uniref:Uncharacterized protein n=1 Tax=Knipowitschia caucasica TaxID=637954 RepID=A0AAV2L1N4_KNICA
MKRRSVSAPQLNTDADHLSFLNSSSLSAEKGQSDQSTARSTTALYIDFRGPRGAAPAGRRCKPVQGEVRAEMGELRRATLLRPDPAASVSIAVDRLSLAEES